MHHNRWLCRTARAVLALCSTLAAFVIVTPAAFAETLAPPDGESPTVAASPSSLIHTAVSSGMDPWLVALIGIGAALSAAILAVVVDRTRTAHRRPSVTAA